MSVQTKRAWWTLAILGVLLGCEDPAPPEAAAPATVPDAPRNAPEPAAIPAMEPEPEPGPSLDPTIPYSVAWGVGGGRVGLETTLVDPSGAVTLHRSPVRRGCAGWERGELALSEAQRSELRESVRRNRVLALVGRYSAGIADGTQAILHIVQGEAEYVIYCDNTCPEGVRTFTRELDALMVWAGRADVSWTPTEGCEHDDALWDALRRNPPPPEEE